MPDHVTSFIVTENKKDYNTLVEKLLNKEKEVDFNNIIPMPEPLKADLSPSLRDVLTNMARIAVDEDLPFAMNIRQQLASKQAVSITVSLGTQTNLDIFNHAFAEYKRESSKIKPLTQTQKEKTRKFFDNLVTYGYHSWYEWSINHWGTKWNAYQSNTKQVKVKTQDKENDLYCITFQTAWSTPDKILKALHKETNIPFTVYWFDEEALTGPYDEIDKEDLEYTENLNPVWIKDAGVIIRYNHAGLIQKQLTGKIKYSNQKEIDAEINEHDEDEKNKIIALLTT